MSKNDISLGNFSDEEFINAVEKAEATVRNAVTKSTLVGRGGRALDRLLGKVAGGQKRGIQLEQVCTPPPHSRRKDPFAAPAARHVSPHPNSARPATPSSHRSPRFDAKIETGCLSAKRNRLCTDDLDLSRTLSSPLQVSTPADSGPVPRVNEKTKNFASRCPLINAVQPSVVNKKTLKSTPQKANQKPQQSTSTSLFCNEKERTIVSVTNQMETGHIENCSDQKGSGRLQLSAWGLPPEVTECYQASGITKMFEWQAECLCLPGVLEGRNLVYSAPTSAGKTLVAELLVLKRVLETRRKAILILPFVSVAREKMNNLQKLFQDAGIRVDGFIGGNNPAGGFSAVDIAVCTIEKANSLINRLLDDGSINTVGTVVVDELHMVGDSHRGYLLELLLTKIRFMTSRPQPADSEGEAGGVQVVGMSATLPNLDLLGRWLDALVYQTDFRPVPLTESLKVGTTIYDNTMKKVHELVPYAGPVKGDEDHVVSLCMETLSGGHSILIFCPTKNWCEKLAMNIANNFFHIIRDFLGEGKPPVCIDRVALRDVIEQLKRTPVGLDNMLAQIVPHGVAYHHAGLTFDERDIIEGAFRNGALRVLVATSTLSSGVNLPARRVLIRTPKFHGQTLDTLTYKQMVGRAGRKGVDTMGESVLLCKAAERDQGRRLLTANLAPVSSCLLRAGEQLSSSMKRAILEVVVSGVARTPTDVERYAACTMLAASEPGASCSKDFIMPCIKFLTDSEFIVLRKASNTDGVEYEQYQSSQLGRAVLSSALSPDEGLIVFAELQRARRNFVLENELHILYQVTPIYQTWTNIDWYHYMCTWEALPPDQRRVAECVGVSEAFLARAVQGRVPSKTAAQQRALAIHRRFYTALVLQDLIQEVPLPCVADKYRCTRGVLQSLQQSAATFSGMVTVFCAQLGWNNLELLLAQFQSRLTFGVQRELVDLVRISLLNGHRARVLFNAGYQTVSALANATAPDIERLLRKAVPFQSMKKGEGESEWELAERRKVRCIWVTGQQGVSEQEAAISMILEARHLVEEDLGMVGIQWKPYDKEANEGKKETSSKSTALEPSRGNDSVGNSKQEHDRSNVLKAKEGESNSILREDEKTPIKTALKVPALETAKPSINGKENARPHSGTSRGSSVVDSHIVNVPQTNTVPSLPVAGSTINTNTEAKKEKQKPVLSNAATPQRNSASQRIVVQDSRHKLSDQKTLVHADKTCEVLDDKISTKDGHLEKQKTVEPKPFKSYMSKTKDFNVLHPSSNNNQPPPGPNTEVVEPLGEVVKPQAEVVEPIPEMADEFNDSFVLDTQLANLISEPSASDSKVLSLPNKKVDLATKPSESLRMTRPRTSEIQNSNTKATTASHVQKTPDLKRVFDSETMRSSKNGHNVTLAQAAVHHQQGTNKSSGRQSKSATTSKSSSKGASPSAELSLQLDLSHDDDLEDFMDQYCTQMMTDTGLQRHSPAAGKPCRQSVAQVPVAIKVANNKHETGNQQVGPDRTEQVAGTDMNTSGVDDLWSDLEGAIDVSTGDELALGSSFNDSPRHPPASQTNHVSSLNDALPIETDEDPLRNRPVIKPLRNVLNVSQNEEMAYLSLCSNSSALLELADDVVGHDEAANEHKVQEDLSQYFEENFGSYGAALNDSWSFTLNKGHHADEVETGQISTKLSTGLEICSDQGQKNKGQNIFQIIDDPVDKFMKPSDDMLPSKILSGERKRQSDGCSRKRKSEEKAPGCTPSKQRKTSDAANESGGDGKNESNASDCVPPTPPDPSTTTPKTQSKKSAKKSSKTPSRRSKRLKESSCAAELKYPNLGAAPNVNDNEQATDNNRMNLCSAKHKLKSSPKRQDLNLSANHVVHPNEGGNTLFNSSGDLVSLSQSIPLTNERFTIIDVAADKRLFEHFIQEWQSKSRYALCFACEKLNRATTPGNIIGGNFASKRTIAPVCTTPCLGLAVEEAGLQIMGLAVSWDHRDVYYVSFSKDSESADPDDSLAPPPLDNLLPLSERLQATQTVLDYCPPSPEEEGEERCAKVMFDAREQYKLYTLACGGNMTGPYQDPKVALWMLDPGAKEQSLHRMVHNRLPLDAFLLEGLGGGIGLGSLGLSPDNPGSGRVRACTEAVLVSGLMSTLTAELSQHGMLHAFMKVEMPVQIILACMELNGFGFSEEECARQKAVLDTKLTTLEEEAYSLAGHSFSLSSPDDIAQVLYMELKLPPSGDPANPTVGCKTLGPARRGRGARGKRLPFTTSKDILEKLRPLHPLPAIILEWRRLTAALTKVVFPLTKEKVYNTQLGMSRIHSLCQTHTATGRVSMAEPNIQNIPKDFEIDVEDQAESIFSVSMRHAFVPFQGGILVAADYSQLELRIIAHLSADRRLIGILNEGRDVFRLIAAQWKGVEVEDVTTEQRQQAKQVCYGMVYGIGAKALGEQLGIEEEEATVFIETFKAKYTGMRSFLRSCVQKCREKGYVETMLGRRRYLPSIKDTNPHARAHAERQAVNTTVQGSAADLVKKAMVLIEERLQDTFKTSLPSHRHKRVQNNVVATQSLASRAGSRAYLLLQLHDELIYEVPTTRMRTAAAIIQDSMERAIKLEVQMPVKLQAGATWGTLVELAL